MMSWKQFLMPNYGSKSWLQQPQHCGGSTKTRPWPACRFEDLEALEKVFFRDQTRQQRLFIEHALLLLLLDSGVARDATRAGRSFISKSVIKRCALLCSHTAKTNERPDFLNQISFLDVTVCWRKLAQHKNTKLIYITTLQVHNSTVFY